MKTKQTEAIRARIREVARIRFNTPTDKELAEETGYSRFYIAQLIKAEFRNLKLVTIHVEHEREKIAATPEVP